jgi:TonB-linked SusC/RagA family outer membrane protein
MPSYLLTLLFSFSFFYTVAQVSVTGTVSNTSGDPVAGASVFLKNAKAGTRTDEAGNFVLPRANTTGVIVISSIGYKTAEIPIDGRSTLNVILKDSAGVLQDVVVEANTGYQRVAANEFNGSLVVVSEKQLQQQAGTSILQRLNNVTSSLQFYTNKSNNNVQSDLNISIRGLSTIEGPLNPVVVLDNFIYEGDINNIHPNDVESITVLKDAAATSLYGARGGNGVIVITTKKGKRNQRMKINASAHVIITEKPDLFDVPLISPADYIDVEQFIFRRGYFDGLINSDAARWHAFTPAVQTFIETSQGLITPQDSAARINAFKQNDLRNDLLKHIYRQALTQQYSVNLRGGSGNHTYTLAVNYDDVSSSVQDKSKKLNVRVSQEFMPVKRLHIHTGLYYTNQLGYSGSPTRFQVNGRDVPYLRLADDVGNPLPVAVRYSDTFTDTAGRGLLQSWKYFPLTDYKHDRFRTAIEAIVANTGIRYEIPALGNFELQYQYNRQSGTSSRISDGESYHARNTVNLFSQIDYSTGSVTNIIPKGGIHLHQSDVLTSQQLRSQFNLKKIIGDHMVTAIAGAEVRESETEGNAFTHFGVQVDPLTTGEVDNLTSYPTFVEGYYDVAPGSSYLIGTTQRFVSLYTNALYQYRERYSVSASARRDGSNIFGATTNDKWKPLWSAALGWNLSREPFLHVSWINHLKLKSSLGFSGNLDPTRTPLPLAFSLTSPATNLPAVRIFRPNDPSLRWEKSRQWNLGVEFSLVKNRISGSIEYYQKKGTDLYGSANYDYTTFGRGLAIVKNVASMSGKGVDVILNSRNIDAGKFKWSTNLLFNYQVNKTTAYFQESALTGSGLVGSSGITIAPVVGKPLYAMAAFRSGGLDANGDPQGYLDGRLSTDYEAIIRAGSIDGLNADQVVYIGAASPTVFGSVINNFQWKGLTINVNIGYRLGYYFRRPALAYSSLFDYGGGHSDFAKRWQRPGDERSTTVPAMVYLDHPQFYTRDQFYQAVQDHIKKADHVRLNYVNLEYEFGIVAVYVNASNLGILWAANEERLDPDYAGSVPPAKTIAAGVRVSL